MSPIQPKKQTQPSRKKLRRALLTTTLLLGTQGLYGIGAQAAIAPAGQVIQNKATGSFVDTDNSEKAIESNIVQVTVAEVTGITIVPVGVTGTPSLGATIYFDFTVTNTGNDPTQFFIPNAPSSITGGTAGTIQIIQYDPDGSGPTAPTALAVNVPAGSATGSMSGNAAFNNGSIPAGGTITVRVPVTVTATGNNPVTVTLGNTPAAPNNQNQDFIASGNDLYTFDNTGTTNGDLVSGPPINGDAANHRKEASATLSTTAIPNITGTVFEDVNYGGGAGRPFGTAGTVGRIGATVELYKSDGTYITSTTTIAGGAYTFTNVPANADYIVRVVNSTVSSSRPNTASGLLPVQTFRTDAATGTALSVTDHVGGENPAEEDAPARSGSQTLAALNALPNKEVQSVTTVKVGSTDTTAVDFGYNFDTIVNTNDSGQGSLRQFITNSNALLNTGLAQAGLTAGKETSIFMIPDGAGDPGLRSGLANQINGTGGNAGAAVITINTQLPTITDANTWLDASTQKTNVGNNPTGTVGTGGTVGVDNLTLSTVPVPSVMIKPSITDIRILDVNGSGYLLKGFGVYGTYNNGAAGGNDAPAAIAVLSNGTSGLITQLLVGTLANGADPGTVVGVGGRIHGHGIAVEGGSTTIENNYFAYITDGMVLLRDGDVAGGGRIDPAGNAANSLLINNEFANTDYTFGMAPYADVIQLHSDKVTIKGNLIRDQLGAAPAAGYVNKGVEIWFKANNNILENNTIHHMKGSAIGIYEGSNDNLISRNVLHDNGRAAIVMAYANILGGGSAVRNTISQNSIYANTGLGIDIDPGVSAVGSTGDGVSANNGASPTTLPNYGMDYPIVTSSTLSGGTLTLKGFVGSNPAGSTTFANAKLEFFIADNTDNDQNGEVILGDGRSLPHGEGKTYLGSCTADSNGLFGTASKPCVLSNVPGTLSPRNITATATDTLGNTSEFSAPAINNPNVLLVKRITAIKRKGTSSFVSNTTYTDDPSYAYDDNDLTIPAPATPSDPPEDTNKWPDPTLYLQGLIDGGAVNPGDEVEFTIYFLSTGVTPAKSMALCDVLPKNMTFVADSFNGSSPTDTGSLPGENLGIAVANDATTLPSAPTIYLTNIGGDDQAQFIPSGSVPPAVCKDPSNSSIGLTAATNTTGAIYLQLRNDLPPATAQGDPTNSYGFVRFRAKVN